MPGSLCLRPFFACEGMAHRATSLYPILPQMVDQITLQPFFDSLGQPVSPHAPTVNATATARMERALASPVDAPGRGILLRAPRAGFGKSHLLSQVQHRLSATHEFLPLNPLDGSRIDAPAAIEAALRRLTRQLPAGGGLTALDLQARRIFSLALQPLVNSGEVPCQDREAALAALRQRPVETFDFHHSQAVTAHWTKENFEVLGPRLALELSRRTGISLNEASFWLASLFRFAIAVPEHPGRTGMIIQSATPEAGVERYAGLLALLSLIGRVVVAADDVEGMHSDPTAALRFASFLASTRQEAPRVDVVVALNDDVWESAFRPALSGGLQDRLGELEIRLEPLDQAGAIALLESRMPGRASELGTRLGLAPGEFYARKVLRKASELVEDSMFISAAAPAGRIEQPASATVAPPPVEVEATNPFSVELDAPAITATPAAEPAPPPPAPPAPRDQPFSREAPGFPPSTAPPRETPPEPGSFGFASQKEPAEPQTAQAPLPPPVNWPKPDREHAATEAQDSLDPHSGGDRIDDLLRQFRERYGRE